MQGEAASTFEEPPLRPRDSSGAASASQGAVHTPGRLLDRLFSFTAGARVGRWTWVSQLIPWAVLMLGVIVDVTTPSTVNGSPLLVAAPISAAVVLGTVGIASVGLTTLLTHLLLATDERAFGWQYGLANQLTIAGVTLLAMGLHQMVVRREASIRRVQRVSEIAQRAILPTPPESLGPLRIASRYLPAEDEALIGGDLYVVQETPYGTRALVGDVRGKGMSAVQTAASCIGAFRCYADHARDLPELARWLDAHLMREAERAKDPEHNEEFTTALLVEFTPGSDRLTMVNRGHPAPLLLRPDGTVRELPPSREAPPLGIGVLERTASAADTLPFPPGSTLLCHTDGLTEARNAQGEFYDVTTRLPALVRPPGGRAPRDPARHLLETVASDVRRHTGGRAQDDQGLLALHHTGLPAGERTRRPEEAAGPLPVDLGPRPESTDLPNPT
ncbi:PP2C family protein-serine/threonine phosphatase [Streptomyces sp. NPDC005438]|uniref:PP2C family protein-serine/threonine phosphatase n=1 Tax=Streptomyces sp. NPDC005438 TaxID=3156880 RepID=UPI0033B7FE93